MPIRWRLTLYNALAIGTILAVLGLALFLLVRHQQLSSIRSTVESRALAAADDLRVTGGSGGSVGVTLDPEEVEEFTLDGVFILVRDRDGEVLTQTVNPSAGGEGQDTVWREVLRSGEAASGTAELSGKAPNYVYAMPVRENGRTLVLEAGRSYNDAEEVMESFGAILAAVLGVAFLVSIVGAYLLARAALKPVDVVVSAAREMTEGDLSRRLPAVNPKDEIGRLAGTINVFLARLEAAFVRQREVIERQWRFAADASHELRTPVTAILGHSRMLKRWGIKDPDTTRRSIDAIETESERMRGLIEALLALTRGDDGAPLKIGKHDLGEVAEEAVETARATAGGRVCVRYAPAASDVEARFDRGRVREAASILLDNAVKYTPEGGNVTVGVSRRGKLASLEVADTGIGIPEDQIPLVFERFYRVESSRAEEGSGLGLSIARQVAVAHGGTIEVKSTPGKGSTFTLLLPERAPFGD